MKNQSRTPLNAGRRSIRSVAALLIASGLSATCIGAGAARADNAASILRAMSDYIANQKNVSISYDSDIEIMTPDMQKIQFASSGQLTLHRPDKLRVTRTGGYADVELVYDGANFTVSDRARKVYGQMPVPGTIDQLVDRIRDKSGIEAPGADLLLANSYAALMDGVYDAKHIGRGVIDGHECEHLAFRTPDADWQIWIEPGATPIPRKYIITTKTVTGAPQYTLRISSWKTGPDTSADAFAFKPSADMKKRELQDLGHIDEIPPGISPSGENK
ncbi:DUF2092 domain-containing protein [Tardiphaga sp.]|uniref:DUF2092 domain-containing protein n=1 Tax=Tardiphaga sp. TaxID=1926292 RepID=UPI00352A4632